MSAYVVSKAHIAALVRLGLAGPSGRTVSPDSAWYRIYWGSRSLDHETAQRTARMLADACVASVKYRYPDDTDDTLPGPMDHYWTDADLVFDIHGARPLTAIEGLKALDGFGYQSCELPTWRESEAYQFCDSLRGALIATLPGYSDAETWSIDERVLA